MQTGGELEDTTLALYLCQSFFAAGVSHVLAVDDDARVAAHLVVQAGVDKVGHGARRGGLGVGRHHGLGRERRAGGVQVLGVNVALDARNLRQRGVQRALGSLCHLVLNLVLDRGNLLSRQNALAQEAHLHLRDGVAQRIGLALGSGAIPLVVV